MHHSEKKEGNPMINLLRYEHTLETLFFFIEYEVSGAKTKREIKRFTYRDDIIFNFTSDEEKTNTDASER